MKTIREGYELPFRETPPASFERNNRSACEDPLFVRAEVLTSSEKQMLFSSSLLFYNQSEPSLGIIYLIYLDDILTLGPPFEAAQRNRDRAVEVLAKTGFIISQDKAQGPCSRLKYPEPRRVQLRALASFLGFIQSCSKALGPVVRIRTRVCYH